MDWYLIFKLIHVAAAVVWIGMAVAVVIITTNTKGDAEVVDFVQKATRAGERAIMPAGLTTLISGLITAWLGNLWSQAWVILGLAGVAAALTLGATMLLPRAKSVLEGYDAGGVTPALTATTRDLLTLGRFDLALMFTIVADMVLKPQWGDWIEILVLAAILVAAGALFVAPVLSKRARPA